MKLVRLLVLLLAWPLAAAAAPAPFLWVVKTPTAHHYLMGSIHLLPPAAYPLPAALDAAYAEAQGVVFESDLAALATPEVQMQMLTAARADSEAGLKAQVPPALYEQLGKRAAELGMPLALCDSFKPWFCALTLEVFSFQHAGFDAGLGIDQHYFNRATEDDKPVRWLEPVEQHLALFTEMPAELSQQFLAATVEEQSQAGQNPGELLRIWRDNDVATLDKAAQDLRAEHPNAYERLLAGRNRAWLPRLGEIFADRATQLVIVGAAHLSGPDGLVALLRQKGYVVEPVNAAPLAPAALAAPELRTLD